MKIVIVNCGTNNNTVNEVVNDFKEKADSHNTAEIIGAEELISSENNTDTVVSKMAEANIITFVSPLYSSGTPAQLELVLDKLQPGSAELNGKMAGIFITGTAPETDPQYRAVNEKFLKTAKDFNWDVLFSRFYTLYDQDTEDRFYKNYNNMCKIRNIGQSIGIIADLSQASCKGPVKYQEDIIEEIHAYNDRAVLISSLWKVENSKLKWWDESSYGMCTCFLNIKDHREILAEIMELFKDKTWYYNDVTYSEEKKNLFYRKMLG